MRAADRRHCGARRDAAARSSDGRYDRPGVRVISADVAGSKPFSFGTVFHNRNSADTTPSALLDVERELERGVVVGLERRVFVEGGAARRKVKPL